MKTGNLFKILLLIIFATTFVACESQEKDGDWESMKWETNVSNINKNKIEVPNEGGVYVFKCTNYKSFWIYALSENGEYLSISYEDKKIEREWYSFVFTQYSESCTIFYSSKNSRYSIFLLHLMRGILFCMV